MGGDDRTADRQAHPYPAGFRRVESVENALEILRINARAGIAHSDENRIGLRLFGADRQVSCARFDRTHRLGGVEDQVQRDLLQLNTIPFND